MTGSVLSRPLAIGGIHGSVGLEILADDRERAALAAAYDLLGVARFSATTTVTTDLNGAVEVSGRVAAEIEQACVVSLAPVAQRIDEAFSVRFVRPGSPELPEAGRPHAEVVVDPAAPDPPEVLAGNSVDVGRVAEEAFVLAIDPYPRAEGAVLPSEAADVDGGPASPFAVLAALKSRKG